MNIVEHKKEIENKIVEIMLTAFKANTITEEEMSAIANVVLEKIDSIQDQMALTAFLEELASRWKIFSSVLVLDRRDDQEKVENEVAEGVLLLAKHGKIENAIKLAQSITRNH